jgi:hypothetical protein
MMKLSMCAAMEHTTSWNGAIKVPNVWWIIVNKETEHEVENSGIENKGTATIGSFAQEVTA